MNARRPVVSIALLALVFALTGPSAAFADPGDLDANWSADGRQLTSYGNLDDEGEAVTVQADEKVVVVGTTGNFSAGGGPPAPCNDWAVVRYRADGVLDSTFGPAGNGRVRLDGDGACDEGNGVAVDGSQRIVATGRLDNGPGVARFLPTGALDGSFNAPGADPGTVVLPFDGEAEDVVLDGDGNILIVGTRTDFTAGAGSSDLFVARFEPDGDLDTTFNPGGPMPGVFFLTLGPDVITVGRDVTLQPDGKPVAVGTLVDTSGDSTEGWLVVRLTTGGVLDGSFNPGGSPPGTLTLFEADNGQSGATSVAMQGTKPVVAGFYSDFSGTPRPQGVILRRAPVVRLTSGGSLDASFANAGVKFVEEAQGDPGLLDVMVQPDRKIVVAGRDPFFTSSDDSDMFLARLTKDGAYDSTFHADGRVHVDFGGREDGRGATLQLDGNILIVGSKFFVGDDVGAHGSEFDSDIAVARVLGDFKGLDCTVSGTPGNDVLTGSAHADVLCGGAGNDTLKGFKGNDILRGGQGNDTLEGGLGADYLGGYAGNDTLNAADGAGGDVVEGASGADTCSTDPGDVVIDC